MGWECDMTRRVAALLVTIDMYISKRTLDYIRWRETSLKCSSVIVLARAFKVSKHKGLVLLGIGVILNHPLPTLENASIDAKRAESTI